MPKIGKSDTNPLHHLVLRSYNVARNVRKDVVRTVLEVNLGVCDNVKRRMPVLTGRAKAGWARYTPQDLVMTNVKSNPSDAVWIVSEQGMSIQQGTNVLYTQSLERGHSQQAPAGFIALAVEFGREEMHVRCKRLSVLSHLLGK